MRTLLQDMRYAVRMLTQRPGFTGVVILTLALGVAVNGAVFFFVSSFLLRPLPAGEPDQLVVIAQKVPQSEMPFPFSYPDLAEFRRAVAGGAERAGAFTDVMAYKEEPVHLSRPGAGAERTTTSRCSAFDPLADGSSSRARVGGRGPTRSSCSRTKPGAAASPQIQTSSADRSS
jgi:hypothetical protein